MTDATPSAENLVDAASNTDGAEFEPDTTEDATEEPTDWELLAAEDIRSRGELLAELSEAESRRDEYLDALQRARAEFDNFRKRTLREGAVQRLSGQADVMARLLDVLDDFDRTMDAIGREAAERRTSQDEGADEGLVTGVGLVRDKFAKTLADAGLERIDQVGVNFDPNQHEAVQQRPVDEPTGQPVVVEIFRPGYRLGDRVLRAAMVVVEQ